MRIIKLKNGTWQVDESKSLGKPGGFGAVYEGTDPNGMPVAIKLLHKSNDNARELKFAEYFCGQSPKHIVPILDFGVDETIDRPCIVMRRAESNLRTQLIATGQFSEADCLVILIDLARGLTEAGSWVHRDIKPENSLFLDGRWHLADFGLARQADAATVTGTVRLCMTYPYAAPEQLNGLHATRATDIYALGCVGAELLSGKLAFPGPHFAYQHLHDAPIIENASPRLGALLRRMMAKEPEWRPATEDVLIELESIRTPRSIGGTGSERFRDAVTRQNDLRARVEAERIDNETRQKHRHQVSQTAQAILVEIGGRLHGAIRTSCAQAIRSEREVVLPKHPFPIQQRNVPGPQQIAAPFIDRLRYLSLYAAYGAGSIALTSGMLGVNDGIFNAAGWNVFCGDVIAVWKQNYVRSASLWYASIDGRKPRWYEVGYYNPSMRWHYPTALTPGHEAVAAVTNKGDGWILAHPPREVDESAVEHFVDRWMTWFGEAVDGELAQPSTLPET